MGSHTTVLGARRVRHAVSVTVTAWALVAAGSAGSASAQDFEGGGGLPAAFEISSYAADAGISEAEARTRLANQRRMPALARRARASLGASYTGLWVDNADNGKIKLVVRREYGRAEPAIEERRKAAAAIVDSGLADSDVEITAGFTGEADMLVLQDALDQELLIPNVGATTTIDAEPDVASGRVHLLVPPQASDAQKNYLNYAMDKYAGRVELGSKPQTLTAEACSSEAWCDPPLRGGIRLIYGGNGTCTSGFVVRSLSDGVRYLSTAGHCISGGGTWSTHFANGSSHDIGVVHNYGTWNDFAILRINNPSGWNPGPYVRTQSDDTYRISGWSTSYVGMRVCKSGSFTGSSCGTVTGGEATRDGHGHTFRADYCGDRGDSGGSVFASGSAHGSHMAGYGACDKIYFDVQNFPSFNVQVVT